MKHKLLTSLILTTLAITLCGCNKYRPSTVDTINVYNLDALNDSIYNCKTTEAKVRFIKNEPLVPYLTLKDYASLYESHFDYGVSSTFSKKGDIVSWTVIKNSTLYFITQVDFKNKEVVSAGSLEATYKATDDPRDTASLYYGINTEYEGKYLGNSMFAHYSFDELNIDCFSYMGEYYLPLSFYDMTYCFDSGIYFYYNYNAIYSAREVDSFYTKKFTKNGKEYSVASEMLSNKPSGSIPDYLLNLNNNLFFYLLDNFYGLKQYKGIKNAVSYCQTIGTYNDIFSHDDSVRTQAYASTLDYLDDNHTALVAGSFVWGSGSNFKQRQYGTGCLNRSSLHAQLTSIRKNATSSAYQSNDESLISSDGKTAMYLFDQFIFGATDEVFNRDGSIKDSAKYYDSFFNLLDFFKDMKELGTVENVILDISTNGGGVLGVLMKLLALISTNNLGNLYYLEGATKQLGIAKTQVDSNFDGSYDTADCYGDDFNIYLLTSDCSFSCGNAFPCLAQTLGARVIGQKSGGGECAVAIHYLPNGEYVYHSSNLHIGYYDAMSDAFTGFENGATPDITVTDYNNFFNVNYLASIIQNA